MLISSLGALLKTYIKKNVNSTTKYDVKGGKGNNRGM